jgi:hypothetical protein
MKVETPTKAGKGGLVEDTKGTEDKEWLSPGAGRVLQ